MGEDQEITKSWSGLNNNSYVQWVILVSALVVVEEITLWKLLDPKYLKHMFASTPFIISAAVKLLIKWRHRVSLDAEKKFWTVQYYEVHFGRVCMNRVPFDAVSTLLMQYSVVLSVCILRIRDGDSEDAMSVSGFEFLNLVFGCMIVSNFMLTFKKAEACRLTFNRFWLLYLSYFTLNNESIYVKMLYALVFIVTMLELQKNIIFHYFGYPSIEEYAIVHFPSFRCVYLSTDATKLCAGFNTRDEYCVVDARAYQTLSEPRFFTPADLHETVLPMLDVWKRLESFFDVCNFHRKYDLVDRLRYLRGKSKTGNAIGFLWHFCVSCFRCITSSDSKM